MYVFGSLNYQESTGRLISRIFRESRGRIIGKVNRNVRITKPFIFIFAG